MVAVIIIIIYL